MITNYFYDLSESIIIISLFCIFYLVVFQKETSFKQNRLFLITGVLLSLVMPFLDFSYPQNLQNIAMIKLDSISIMPNKISDIQQSNSYKFFDILFIIYLTVSAVFFIRMIYQIIKITSFLNNAKIEITGSLKVVYTGKTHSPFSFVNYVFIDKKTESSNSLDIVIKHEAAHITQAHSIDLILFELLLIIQWFNPLVWIYGKKIKENHEFLADSALIDKGVSAIQYQQTLLSTHSYFQYDLINNFNNSLTFKRLIMMTKKSKSKMTAIIKLIAIVPILLMAVYLVSCSKEQDEVERDGQLYTIHKDGTVFKEAVSKSLKAAKSKEEINGEPIYFVVEEMPVFEGGDLGLRTYIANNVKYPTEAKEKGISGKVYIRFTIDTDGSVVKAKVVKSVHPSIDNEALRVIKSLPKWKPGKNKGVPVPVFFTVPIYFALQ